MLFLNPFPHFLHYSKGVLYTRLKDYHAVETHGSEKSIKTLGHKVSWA